MNCSSDRSPGRNRMGNGVLVPRGSASLLEACRRIAVGLCVVVGVVLGCGDEEARTSKTEGDSPSAAETADTTTAPSSPKANASDTMAAASDDTSASGPSASRGLSSTEKKRLGPTLQRLLRGDSLAMERVDPVSTKEGAPVYEVTIRTENPDALREAGLPLTSVQGTLVTARLTLDQLRSAASTTGVRTIRAAKQLEPHEAGRESSSPQ